MPRPTTKQGLLELAEVNFNKLWDFIEELPDEIKNKTYKNDELNDRDKTVSDVIALIETFSNEELFSKKSFAWTGTSTLGAYCISATSSHYDWGSKTIKPLKKLVKK